MLPAGVRPRQLRVRTLLAGMCLAQADHRPAHLTRVHQALTALREDDQRRLGRDRGLEERPAPAHLPADRAHLRPGRGRPRQGRARRAALRPAAGSLRRPARGIIPEEFKDASRSLAVDWTDLESFSRPPPHGTSDCADPEASWGHRKNNLLRSQDELFYGYYLSAGIMMPEENGPAVPELARRASAVVVPARPGPRLRPRADRAARPGDPARRHPRRLRLRAPRRRRLGDPAAGRRRRSSSRTCTRTTAAPRAPTTARSSPTATSTAPCTPRPLLELGPLARTATREQAADHDRKTAELARYKLGRLTADDPDGYHRVQCPAAMGKIRCPLRPASMTLDRDRPEILHPPEHPQACCAQQTITVPPDVLAKTAVAVGTALAGGPPHRSQRAGLPHWAPTLGA